MRFFLLLLLLHCYFCATFSTVLLHIATLPLCPSSTVDAAAGYNDAQRKLERLLQRKIIVMPAIIIPILTNKIMQKGTKYIQQRKARCPQKGQNTLIFTFSPILGELTW